MTWPLRYFASERDAYDAAEAQGLDWPTPGSCYHSEGALHDPALSAKYLARHRGTRLPIVVWCPGPAAFFADNRASRDAADSGGGWDVVGDIVGPVPLTVSPSILVHGRYHGFIRDGVLTDDLDGNHYDEHGRKVP